VTDSWHTENLVADDKRFLWHPFTQMRDWCAAEHEPLVLVGGEGAVVRDSRGREYLDGNASIWTNLHGHNHPTMNAAVRGQLERIAHTSFLGFTNPPAIELARRLVELFPGDKLTRVFYSDDGSTAIEVAVKMAIQYRQLRGETGRTRFVSFAEAYHGDTMGASSLGGVSVFHDRFARYQFPVVTIPDLDELESLESPETVAAVAIEPLVQGAAGMRLWPPGTLGRLRAWCDAHGVHLIADEIMTGFGRTGTMFACEREGVTPDFVALAKGLTGGYMPLAATLTREEIYAAFLGSYEEMRSFFYGHSYTGNALGCAAALGSLRVFEEEGVLERLGRRIRLLGSLLRDVGSLPHVGEVRQCGFVAGIEVMADPEAGEPYDWRDQTGARICLEARKHGLLTRPIRDVVVLMPPYCITATQLRRAVGALVEAISAVCGGRAEA
jgi:adenosylmethionine-8-amino-7-oxononanoate aminotransferase